MTYRYAQIGSADDLVVDNVYIVIPYNSVVPSHASRFHGFHGDLAVFQSLTTGNYFEVPRDGSRYDTRIVAATGVPQSVPRFGRPYVRQANMPAPVGPPPAPPRFPVPAVIPSMNVPRGSTNAVTMEEIENDEILVNFQDERALGDPRYYKKTTFNQLNPRRNPYTRQEIIPTDPLQHFSYYKARLTGGKRSGSKRRKARKTRKTKKVRKTRKTSKRS